MTGKPASPIDDRPKSKRRMRFSLRTLLILVLVAAVVSAGLGWRWRRAQRQAAIVEKIRATGVASVMYEHSVIVPEWLRNWLGDDFFSDVLMLAIGPTRPTSTTPPDGWKLPLGARGVSARQCHEVLALAAPLPQIRSLIIHQAVVRKEALEQLTCWEQLTDVRIDGCDIGDDDLAPLGRATNVRNVSLHRQPIGDRGLAHLRNMSQLRELGLGVTNVTDDGLAELANFPHLQELWVFGVAGISDRGMVHVGRCAEMKFLELSSTAVGDDGIRELARLPELHYLNLCKTRVTDAGVKHLAPLAKLDEGLFFGTTVTQAGVDQVPSLVKSKGYLLGKPSKPVAPATKAPVGQ